MEKTIEKKIEVKSLMVFDSDKGDFVQVTPDMQRHAAYVHQQIAMGTFMIALAIKKMFDEKLYLGLGCSNKTEYCETMLPFGRQQAYKYYKIGKKFQKYLPGDSESVAPGRHFEDLGYKKLYELTKLDDADFEELIETGEIDGFKMEQFKKQTYNEAMKEINLLRRKSSKKISILEEENKKLKSEMQSRERLIEEANEKYKQALEMEDVYGPMKTSVDDRRRVLNNAIDMLNHATKLILNCKVTVDDPPTLKHTAVEVYKILFITAEYWKDYNGELLLSMEDFDIQVRDKD